jgi:peroxiredoxin
MRPTVLSSLRAKLDTLVNVVILATCVVVAVGIYRISTTNRVMANADVTPFTVGMQAEKLPDVKYEEPSATLVAYVRSTCGFCTMSMPFYERLAGETQRAGVRFVAVSNESLRSLDNYLKEYRVSVSRQISFEGVQKPTPTLVLVDRKGTIVETWVGKQDADGERQIVQRIRAASGLGQLSSN